MEKVCIDLLRAKAAHWYYYMGLDAGPYLGGDVFRADLLELKELCESYIKAGCRYMEPGSRINELAQRTGLV